MQFETGCHRGWSDPSANRTPVGYPWKQSNERHNLNSRANLNQRDIFSRRHGTIFPCTRCNLFIEDDRLQFSRSSIVRARGHSETRPKIRERTSWQLSIRTASDRHHSANGNNRTILISKLVKLYTETKQTKKIEKHLHINITKESHSFMFAWIHAAIFVYTSKHVVRLKTANTHTHARKLI